MSESTPADASSRKPHRWIAVVLGIVVVIGGTGLAWYLGSSHDTGNVPVSQSPTPTEESQVPSLEPPVLSPEPSTATPSPLVCDPGALTRISITLSTDAADMDLAASITKIRVDASGFPGNVTHAASIAVDICQEMTDEDVTWLTGWLTHSGDFSIHQVLGQVSVYDNSLVPSPGSDLSRVDADLAAKLAWRPSADDLTGVGDQGWCGSHPGFTTLDPALGSGLICDTEQQITYLVGPTLMDGTDVESAYSPTGNEMAILDGPSIIAQWTNKGAFTIFAATDYIRNQVSPQNTMAIILDGVVLGASTVMEAIDVPALNFTAPGLTERDVPMLAAVVGHSQTPMNFQLVNWVRD